MSEPLAGSWIVTAMPGGVLPDDPPSLELSGGRVTGTAGVNRLAGPYVVDGDQVVLGPLAMTRMAGPPERMDQESRFAAAVAGPLALARDGDAIVLSGPAGPLRLEPAPPPPSA